MLKCKTVKTTNILQATIQRYNHNTKKTAMKIRPIYFLSILVIVLSSACSKM